MAARIRHVKVQFLVLQMLALCVFLSFSILTAMTFKTRAADETTIFLKRTVLTNDVRQTLLTLSEFSADSFSGVSYYDGKGRQVFFWPDSIAPEAFVRPTSVVSLHPFISYKTKFHFGSEDSKEMGWVIYLYNPLIYVRFAFIAWVLFLLASLPLLNLQIQKAHLNFFKRERELERERFLSLAKQTAHDIRAPLTALTAVVSKSELGADHNRILENAIERLSGIAESLLNQSKGQSTVAPTELSSHLSQPTASGKVSTIIAEVVAEFADRRSSSTSIDMNLDSQAAEPECKFEASLLLSILRNLITNSSEAISGNGQITVSSRYYQDSVMLVVQDNGRGIPEHIQPLLFRDGATFGKINGNGIGLHSAKVAIEKWGGSIRLQSREGLGTMISIQLRLA